MHMENKRYSIELKVVTPLAVGAGGERDWERGIDYVVKDDKVHVLDFSHIDASTIDIHQLSTLFQKSDEAGMLQLLDHHLDQLTKYVFDLPAETPNPIKTFLRTQLYDRPVVAGSSLKGAIRSTFFKHLRTDEEKNDEVFGKLNGGNDFMRHIQVGDIEMPATTLVNTKIFNLQHNTEGGWKHDRNRTNGHYNPVGFNTLYECVAPGQTGIGTITMTTNAYNLMPHHEPYGEKKSAIMRGGIQALFHIANQATRDYLRKEKVFFQTYPAERTDELIDCIDRLQALIPADDSCCLLKMSAGVGFHSITGDWQFPDYTDTDYYKDGRNQGKKRYKSRKTAEWKGRLCLMGFVLLRTLDEGERDERVSALNATHADIKKGIMAAAQQREEEMAAKKRAEEDEARRREEEKARRNHIQQVMDDAQHLQAEARWEEALRLLQTVEEDLPAEGKQQLEACRQALASIQSQVAAQAAAEQRFSQPLVDVIRGKTSAGNLVGTTAKWLKSADHQFGEEEFNAFVAEARQLPAAEQKKLPDRLSQLATVLGPELLQRLQSALA